MITIRVFDQPTRRLQGISKQTQRDYDMTIQTAYAATSDSQGNPLPVPEKFEIVLDKGQAPYAPGVYHLSPASIYVDRQGRLAVAPKLVPVPAAK